MIKQKTHTIWTKKVRTWLILELLFWCFIFGVLILFNAFDSGSKQLSFYFYDVHFIYYFILCVPLSAAYFWLEWKEYQKQQILKFKQSENQITPFLYKHKIYIKYFLFRTAIFLIIFAAAQPVFGKKTQEMEVGSYDIVVSLDVSASMNVRDMYDKSSRLDVAKRALAQYLKQLKSERISLTIFAENAYTQLYLTKDYELFKLYLNEVNSDMVSKQGSNISSAISTAVNNFDQLNSKKIIILITDGEDHLQKIEDQIQLLKEQKIELVVLGLGTTTGGPIPINSDSPELGYKIDKSGNKIISKLNVSYLESIQKKSGSILKITQEPYPDLSELLAYTSLETIKPQIKTRVVIQKNYYQQVLFLSILFFILYLFMRFLNINRVKKA